MRALWLIIPAVVLAGCDFGLKTCATDVDCMGLNATCDTKTHFCVRDPLDSGMGGGVTGGGVTGGGGGTTGGGSAMGGGSTGGGTPDAGEDAGMDAGGDAGTDGGVDAGVDAGTCNLINDCQVGEECGPNNRCISVSLTIVQVGPVPTVGRLPVAVTGRIQRVSDAGFEGFKLPTEVMLMSSDFLVFPATAPVQTNSTFIVPVTVDAGTGGATISASAALNLGSANGVLSVTTDTIPPTLSIVSAPITAPFKRDDIYALALEAREPLRGLATVTFGGLPLSPSSTACSGDAGCWLIDMSAPTLNAMTGNVDLVISGTDLFGNVGSTTTQVSITRRRWEVPALPNTESARASPAIGSDGTIYLGSVNGAVNAGSLVGIEPTDGGTIKSAATPGAIQSLAVAASIASQITPKEDLVYYSANDTQGRVGARRALDLSNTDIQNAVSGNGVSTTNSALALIPIAADEVGAIASFNRLAFASRLNVFSPVSGSNGVLTAPDGGGFDMNISSNTADVPNNFIIDGTTAYFITSADPNICTSQVVSNVSSTPTLERALPLFSSGNPCGTTAQSWVGNQTLVGGFAGGLSLFKFDATNSTPVSGDLGAAVSNGASAIASNSVAFLGRGNDLIRYSPSMLSGGVTRLATGVNIRTSPVLGKARSNEPAKGYAVDTMGTLRVFDQNGALDTAINFGPVFTGTPEPVRAHPTLDCNRRVGAATSSTGILYVVSLSGRLSAIIVDSPKLLDDSGAWPKYQRTAANAGNTNNMQFPFNPGCPN